MYGSVLNRNLMIAMDSFERGCVAATANEGALAQFRPCADPAPCAFDMDACSFVLAHAAPQCRRRNIPPDTTVRMAEAHGRHHGIGTLLRHDMRCAEVPDGSDVDAMNSSTQ
jgi:hypothetical protein